MYKINGKRVTIPAGFVADGLEGLEQDFCSKPAWILFEFVYATHRLDYCAADRQQVDIYMFNNYPDQI